MAPQMEDNEIKDKQPKKFGGDADELRGTVADYCKGSRSGGTAAVASLTCN